VVGVVMKRSGCTKRKRGSTEERDAGIQKGRSLKIKNVSYLDLKNDKKKNAKELGENL